MPANGVMAAIQREGAADAAAVQATGSATQQRSPTRNDPAFARRRSVVDGCPPPGYSQARRRVEAGDVASFKSSASLASSYAGRGTSVDDGWGDSSFVSRKSDVEVSTQRLNPRLHAPPACAELSAPLASAESKR